MSPSTEPPTLATWRRSLVQYIAEHPDRPLKAKGLAKALRIGEADYPRFRRLVRELLSDGTLVLGPGRSVVLPEQSGRLVGIVRLDRRGDARLERPGEPPVLIQRGGTRGALDGDTVAVRLLKRRGARGLRIGEVTRILARAETRWVGVLEKRRGRWVVQPQGRAPAPLVQIDDPTAKSARPGDMVVVEPLEHTLDSHSVRGVIVERLGDPSCTETLIRAVIRRHGIPEAFPPAVRRVASRAAADFDPEAAKDREDLRNLLTITIDPPDARDFDDAITLRALPGGRVELGVHIADVAHFVPPGGVLDREARRRGNSVYFPGYVVPMLPETLSNGVCSLQPGEPRFAQSVFITYDGQAQVLDTRFCRSLIRSDHRLTYDEVTEVLAGRPTRLPARVVRMLKKAETLARRIQQRRLRAGMIVLHIPEVEIELGPRGEVVDARPADTSFSHTIIEMFMVEANEAVSRLLRRQGIPHLRRIHPPPPEEPLAQLQQVAAALGRRLPERVERKVLRDLLDAARGKPQESAVNLILLQTLTQAVYSPSPEGHFALASEDYCHFTSPIRRYPDLVNHRLLTAWLSGGSRRRRARDSDIELEELGRHCSFTERRAQQAEREAKMRLLLEFMKGKLGECFEGVIIGVASFGVFVQIHPYLAEGLLHVSDFGPDEWHFDKRYGTFIGARTQNVVGLGQPVRVRVAAIDEARYEMDLVPADRRPIGMRLTGVIRPEKPRRQRSSKRGKRR